MRAILGVTLLCGILLSSAGCTPAQVQTTVDIVTCGVKLSVTFANPKSDTGELLVSAGDALFTWDGCINVGNTVLTALRANNGANPTPAQSGNEHVTVYDGVEWPSATEAPVEVQDGPVYITNCSHTQLSTTTFSLSAPWFMDVNGTVYTSDSQILGNHSTEGIVADTVVIDKRLVLTALSGQVSTNSYDLRNHPFLAPGETAVIYPKLKATFEVGAYYVGQDTNPPAGQHLPYWAYLKSVDVGDAYQPTQFVQGDPAHLCGTA